MKPDKNTMCEWRMIVQDSVMYLMNGQADEADKAIIAIDDYIAWLEFKLEDKS